MARRSSGIPSRAARQRAIEEQAAQAREARRRRRRLWSRAGLAVVVVGGAIGAFLIFRPSTTPASVPEQVDSATQVVTGPAGPEGIPLQQGNVLAGLDRAATGQTVQGISCDAKEQTAYQFRAHLTIYVDGVLRPVPGGVGVVMPQPANNSSTGPLYEATQCYYWMHVRAGDGVIFVASPTSRVFTLGEFFAIWGQPLSSTQVGPVKGTLTVYVDGHLRTGDPATIELGSHQDIQIDLGTPVVPPKRVDWSTSKL
jgi:hypothetical protein